MKRKVIIIVFSLLVFLFNLVNAVSEEQTFIVEQNIQQDICSEGYTEASSFVDGNGVVQKICVIKSGLSDGKTYVISSFIKNGETNCTAGDLTGRFSGKIEEGLQDVILCVEKSKRENNEVLLTDISVAEVCPSKFKQAGSFANSEGISMFYCIKENRETGAKIILGTSSIVIIVVLIILVVILFRLFNSSGFSFSK